MRKIGLIGGMSWVSTRTYYEDINQLVQARTSRLTSAPLLIESLDFTDLVRLSTPEQWAHAAGVLADSARRLEQAGATALLMGRMAKGARKRAWSPPALRAEGAFEERLKRLWFDTHVDHPQALELLAAEGTPAQRLERIQTSSSRLWQGLQTIEGVSTLLPEPPPAGLVSFTLAGLPSAAVVENLGAQGLWIRRLDDPDCLRACTHITTTEAEIDQLLGALQAF